MPAAGKIQQLCRQLRSPSLFLFLAILAVFSFIFRLIEVKYQHVPSISMGLSDRSVTTDGKGLIKPRKPIRKTPPQKLLDEMRPQYTIDAINNIQWNPFVSQSQPILAQANFEIKLTTDTAINQQEQHLNASPNPIASKPEGANVKATHKTIDLINKIKMSIPSEANSRGNSTWVNNRKRRNPELGPNEFEYDLEMLVTPVRGKGALSAFSECQEYVQRFNVVPEKSWGGMTSTEDRNRWQALECNTVLKRRGDVKCTELHGKKFVENWRGNKVRLCPDKDHFCYVSDRENHQCVFSGMRLEFNNAAEFKLGYLNELAQQHNIADPAHPITNLTDPRQLDYLATTAEAIKGRGILPTQISYPAGFASSKCSTTVLPTEIKKVFERFFPPFQLSGTTRMVNNRVSDSSQEACDVVIDDPVLIVSHDCMTNMGHLMQDILNWWLVAELNHVPTKSLTLINMDGLRPGTILQGPGRHILDAVNRDGYGPFREIHEVLFGKIISAASEWAPVTVENGSPAIPGKAVCLRNKVFTYPMPLKGFLWDKFEVEDPCSKALQPSYIYRKFVTEYIRSWHKFGNLKAHKAVFPTMVTPYPSYQRVFNESAEDDLRMLLITRKTSTTQSTNEILARAYGNFDEVVTSLEEFVDQHRSKRVTLITADFSDIPFADQVALANSVDVLIGFHGAGINHMFHMDYKRPQCCGVVEIFPQSSGCKPQHGQLCNYYRRIGHGNHCRFLGYQYMTMMSPPSSFAERKGTIVSTSDLIRTVDNMVSLLL